MSPHLQSEVTSITRQLISKYRPVKIILFGSGARNDPHANDLDFLIIKNDVPNRSLDRMRQVRSLVQKKAAADFLIMTEFELQERISLQDPFALQITQHGQLLYG
ncbi:MAG: hypothetical protein G01um101416_48 [Microgenomates group bacterium Gr01-1014_16]|nr:MAG: hypothetical protein G01um101416_48 [Microgenomates group bacterium Gr01-1014_16]